MLDRLLTLEPGCSGTAERRLSTGTEGFSQLFLIECLAQLGGIIAAHQEGEGGFLASIAHAEFEELPREGDTLTITARVVKSFGRLFLIEGEVETAGRTLCRAQLSLGIGRL